MSWISFSASSIGRIVVGSGEVEEDPSIDSWVGDTNECFGDMLDVVSDKAIEAKWAEISSVSRSNA